MKLHRSPQCDSGDPAFGIPQARDRLAPEHFFDNRRGLPRSRDWARHPSLSRTLAPAPEQIGLPLQRRISRD
jgi:hypothetical protein